MCMTTKECEQVSLEHMRYMANNRIEVEHEHEDLPSFLLATKIAQKTLWEKVYCGIE